MVYPITVRPVERLSSRKADSVVYLMDARGSVRKNRASERIRTAQKAPYTAPAKYSIFRYATQRLSVERTNDYQADRVPGANWPGSWFDPWQATPHGSGLPAYSSSSFTRPEAVTASIAMERLLSRLGERAEMLVNVLQYQKARDTAVKRSRQLYRFFTLLSEVDKRGWSGKLHRKFRVAGVQRGRIRIVRRAFRSRWRANARSIGDLALETLFGWLPLFTDLRTSIQILGGSTEPRQISGSASSRWMDTTTNDASTRTLVTLRELAVTVKCGCNVEVSNPNKFLLNRLGLANPLTAAWDLVPWSWFVNQFVNFKAFFNSFNSFYGVKATERWTNAFRSITASSNLRAKNRGLNSDRLGYADWEVSSVFFTRSTSLPAVTLRFKGFRVDAYMAGVYTSLLLQKLK